MTVSALDRANAEDALLPIPKIFDLRERENSSQDSLDKSVVDDLVRSSKTDSDEIEGTSKFYHSFLLNNTNWIIRQFFFYF